jgi:putative methyltransferase (TIGR04325 family)
MLTRFPGGFEAAERACGPGYADPDVVDLVVAKTLSRRAETGPAAWTAIPGLIPGLLPLIGRAGPLRILDFGGAAGFAAVEATRIFPELDLRWAVVETATMVAAAGPALAGDKLGFFTNIAEAASWLGGVDLVHAGSVLQYLDDPEPVLADLAVLGAPSIVFPRTLCHGHGPIVGIEQSRLRDHGPGPASDNVADREIRVPVVLRSRDDYIGRLAPRYALRVRWADGNGSVIFDSATLITQALLFRRDL